MARSDFVAADGTVWHVFAGLPANYPATGDRVAVGDGRAGLTFRADTGEVRVLPRAAIPRTVHLPAVLNASPGARMPVPREEIPDWEALVQEALVWLPT